MFLLNISHNDHYQIKCQRLEYFYTEDYQKRCKKPMKMKITKLYRVDYRVEKNIGYQLSLKFRRKSLRNTLNQAKETKKNKIKYIFTLESFFKLIILRSIKKKSPSVRI